VVIAGTIKTAVDAINRNRRTATCVPDIFSCFIADPLLPLAFLALDRGPA
jgi:hypothetical protein